MAETKSKKKVLSLAQKKQKKQNTELMTSDPIKGMAQSVINDFQNVYDTAVQFIKDKETAIHGFLISGDAGMGKTHYIRKAFRDLGATKHVEYLKGGSITAPALYVKLWLNRHKNRVVVLDDCDIIHRPDKKAIIPLLLGATELSHRPRDVSWERAGGNTLMKEHNVPGNFGFDGSIIWITNDTVSDIHKAAKQWFNALMSRFNTVKCYYSDEQKYAYTHHLIMKHDMLGKKCEARLGGYSKKVIGDALAYMQRNYKRLTEITPRQAIKIADLRHSFPKDWQMKCDVQLGKHNVVI
jgi:hypothetical protein